MSCENMSVSIFVLYQIKLKKIESNVEVNLTNDRSKKMIIYIDESNKEETLCDNDEKTYEKIGLLTYSSLT
jgi:hypothetical protein